jgi:holin-like protein
MQILLGLACLCLSLLAGEVVKDILQVAIPAPVLAVVILVAALGVYGRVPEGLRLVGEFLLCHMALFFIPVLVGMLALYDVLREILAPLSLIIFVSTVVPLFVTAWIFQKLAPKLEASEHEAD